MTSSPLLRRTIIGLAALTVGGTVVSVEPPAASALPCRDFCPSFEPFGLAGSGAFWGYDRWGRWTRWYWFDYWTPTGGTIRKCTREDPVTGNWVGDTCPGM